MEQQTSALCAETFADHCRFTHVTAVNSPRRNPHLMQLSEPYWRLSPARLPPLCTTDTGRGACFLLAVHRRTWRVAPRPPAPNELTPVLVIVKVRVDPASRPHLRICQLVFAGVQLFSSVVARGQQRLGALVDRSIPLPLGSVLPRRVSGVGEVGVLQLVAVRRS